MRKRSLVLMFLFVSAVLSLTFFSLAFASAPPGIAQAVPPEKEVPAAEPADTAEISVLEVGGAVTGLAPAKRLVTPLGAISVYEAEPNDTPATANPLGGSSAVVRGNTFPAGDIDFFSFTAQAGDRVYAATMTAFSPSATDSTMDIYDTDGTTILETDVNDGSFAASSSSIAGLTLPSNGTYYIRVRSTSATATMRPYDLYFQLQSGTPVAETEPNNAADGGQPLPASGWVTGTINPAADNDVFLFALNAGDTVFLSLDLDPERDGGTSWNGRFGLGAFGNPPLILVVNDANTTSPNSEAFFMTVKEAGNYYVYVDHPTAAGTPASTYHLSVSVFPHVPATNNCTTYTSTDVPVTIPTGPGLVTSTLNVPGNPRIADLDVTIVLTHTFMPDVDVTLVAPGGNEVVLFADRGVSTQLQMNLTLDDEAAIPNTIYTVQSGIVFQPSASYRLSWFDGQNAGGDWTLNVYDDTAGDGGVLQSWGLTICEPPPPPTCPTGTQPVTVFSTDFEANNGNFTSSGVEDEWQWGTPTFVPITTCNSGANCWVTDLTGTYNASSNQTLLSPAIDLTGLTGPIIMQWAQKYHIETATFDNAFVQVQEVGGANPTRLWDWLDGTMNATVGNPTVTIPMSAGWGERWADISGYAGQSIEAAFNLSSDTSVQLAGLAIDDVTVTACEPVGGAPAISLSKTVGTTPGVCATTDEITVGAGTTVYYCYQVENTGDTTLNFHDLVDTELGVILNDFPYTLAPGAFSPEVIVSDVALATVTNEATWTAVTALGSYAADDTIPFNWEDISGTGTPVTLTDDSVSGAIPLGFSFTYFGDNYSDIYISSNGFLTVLPGQPNGCCSGGILPSTTTPNGVIAGWWEDLNPSAGGTVHYETLGTAPNRVFIVQFTDIPHFGGGNLVTKQYKLFEGSNYIEVHYQAAPSDGGTHSAGIENAAGTVGVQYYLGTASLPTPLAVRYYETVVASASDTDTATVNVLVQNIDVDPLSLSSTQDPGTVETQTLTIANTGDGTLTWDITEEPTAVLSAITTGGDAALAREDASAAATNSSQAAGAAPALSGWRVPEDILYDNGPLITHPGGGAGGADVSALQTALGMDTFGFGNQVAAGNRVADDFTVTGGGWFINTITFFGYQTGSSTTSTFTAVNLRIWDGPPNDPTSNVVFGDTTTNRMTATGWSNIYRTLDTALSATDRPIMANVTDINTFLPPGTYWVDWQANGTLASGPWAPPISILGQTTTGNAMQFTTAGWANLVDGGTLTPQGLPFIIEGLSDCSNPADVPWVSVDPTSGSNAGGTSTDVTVTFDSTGLSSGTYTANLCVSSNDPDVGPGNGTSLVIVPVELEVTGTTTPAISLVKTVGTEPDACATTDEITVAAGTTVYYCYEVTNTGDVTLNLHDLDDDQLGSIFAGLNYALTPGSSVDTVAAGLTISDTINVTTTNTATWTAYNAGPSDEATATASATVNVPPFVPAPAITIVKTVGTTPGVCATTSTITVASGTTVYYCYTVTNTGNVALGLHDLVDDELGTLVTGLAYDLLPGASVDTVAAGLTVTATITADTTNTATWTAYNAGPIDVATATASATVNVTTVTPSYLIYLPIILKP
ncbi:MAG TPA: proprotein convertase P-domain-containing protein [Chloroflexota bacterium]|nr:proprotein convertase P-domain-containing protein [Chloroflexota bacterium]